MDAAKLIDSQVSDSTAVLKEILSDADTLACHNLNFLYLEQLSQCLASIADRKESEVFRLGLKEYQFSVYALSMGLYRQAFSALRLTMELSLSAIAFSANEIKLRTWLRGQSDIIWSSLIDADTGILSTQFVKVFFEDLSTYANGYRTIAEKVYRECSEFVHGNIQTHRALPTEILFSKQTILSWNEKAESVRLVIVFAFVARFFDDLDEENREELKPVLLEILGHIDVIRVRLGGAVGG